MSDSHAPGLPRFGLRVLAAALTSLAGSALFFVFAMTVVLAAPASFATAIGEPTVTVLIYGTAFALAGLACLAVNCLSFHLVWWGTAKAMIVPYVLVLAVPAVSGTIHLFLSGGSFAFAHSWLGLYLVPAVGAAGVLFVAVVSVIGEVAWRSLLWVLGLRNGRATRRAG